MVWKMGGTLGSTAAAEGADGAGYSLVAEQAESVTNSTRAMTNTPTNRSV
jgi:hypothetical protein